MTNQNVLASIRNSKVQMGQLANIISEHGVGSLLSDIVPNLKEQVHAIVLRSGETGDDEEEPIAIKIDPSEEE